MTHQTARTWNGKDRATGCVKVVRQLTQKSSSAKDSIIIARAAVVVDKHLCYYCASWHIPCYFLLVTCTVRLCMLLRACGVVACAAICVWKPLNMEQSLQLGPLIAWHYKQKHSNSKNQWKYCINPVPFDHLCRSQHQQLVHMQMFM
jgi:hypothetical protein